MNSSGETPILALSESKREWLFYHMILIPFFLNHDFGRNPIENAMEHSIESIFDQFQSVILFDDFVSKSLNENDSAIRQSVFYRIAL